MKKPDAASGSPDALSQKSTRDFRHPLEWASDEGLSEKIVTGLSRHLAERRSRRRRIVGALAMLAVAGTVAFQVWLPDRAATSLPVARTAVHRPELRTLPDGSTVELDRGAVIDVDFGSSWRRVGLRGGAGHFAVVPDKTRPFLVTSDGIEVRAVGTQFVVAPALDRVAVVVTEGRVAVTKQTEAAMSAETPLALVSAGEAVRVTPAVTGKPEVEAVSSADRSALLAWRVPRIEFSDTPLAQAVELFNRHGATRLKLAEQSLGKLQVSGVLRADDPESLLTILGAEFGLVAEQRAGTWLIRRR